MSNIEPIKQSFSLVPTSLGEAIKYSEILASSDMVPKDFKGKPGNCLIAMQWGMELGMAPLQAIQNIAVINGRPSIWGDIGLALVMAHPDYEWHKEEQSDAEAVSIFKRRDIPEVRSVFSMEDAKRAGLASKDGPWKTSPKRMLLMRARWFAMRNLFPDALKGINSAEESRDLPKEKDMGTVEVERGPSLQDLISKKDDTPPPSLADALLAISVVSDKASKAYAVALAERLASEEDKAHARDALKARLSAVKAQQKKEKAKPDIDPVTGEIFPPSSEGFTYAQVASTLEAARGNRDQLDEAANTIGLVADEAHRAELGKLYTTYIGELADQA